MELFDEKDKQDIEEAMEKCKHYISKNATINVIEDSFNSITFNTHDMAAVATLVAAMKKILFYLPFLEHSDASKEQSSMDYYNQMKYWQDKAIQYRDLSSEMLYYITMHHDCPLENEGMFLDCEHRCNNDIETITTCWNQYFEKKVEEYNGKKN